MDDFEMICEYDIRGGFFNARMYKDYLMVQLKVYEKVWSMVCELIDSKRSFLERITVRWHDG